MHSFDLQCFIVYFIAIGTPIAMECVSVNRVMRSAGLLTISMRVLAVA
jgi:hypothetical protein